MEYKSFVSETKEIEGRKVSGFAAIFGNIDLGGDRIYNGSFKKTIKEGMDHIRHLWQHNYQDPPVAVINDLQEISQSKLPDTIKEKYPEVTGGLLVTRTYLDTQRGEEILQGITSGAIKEMSFGYDPIKFDFEEEKGSGLVRNLHEVRLWDTSDVNWGMNPATVASKSAVQFKDTGKDEGDWKAPTLGEFSSELWDDLSGADKSRIANHYAWSEQMPPETFGSIKLPHHKAGDSGVGPAVWKGVAAAMAALLGARGGVQIPDADRKGVYNHLAKHYDQFEKEPPDYKFIEAMSKTLALSDEEIAKGIAGYFKSRVADIELAFSNLKELLSTAEPWEADNSNPALTFIVLKKLELIKNQIKTL